jgi:hypothetical protein
VHLRYVVERKRAPKYEPLSLTDVFQGLLEKSAAPVSHAWKPLIPVILMQENYFLRTALPLICMRSANRVVTGKPRSGSTGIDGTDFESRVDQTRRAMAESKTSAEELRAHAGARRLRRP